MMILYLINTDRARNAGSKRHL